MESVDGLKRVERQKALEHWLSFECGFSSFELQAMPGDASFRRYFRLSTPKSTSVVMDAPPPQENCRPYVAIADALRANGLHAPEIIHANLDQGFLLITDFGDQTYLKALTLQNADSLYRTALDALAILQSNKEVPKFTLPFFTRDFMYKEWDWIKEWFFQKLLGLSLADKEKDLDECYKQLVESAASQPQVFMHRDYHSANLMVLKATAPAVGILDFQDAFIGPLTYDLASLLRDCYIDWPESCVQTWALAYWETLFKQGIIQVDASVFLKWFDWMGLQRHLKALMTFSRKQVRDHQPQYLNHVPRTLNYLLKSSERYPEMMPLYHYFNEVVQPTFERKVIACVP